MQIRLALVVCGLLSACSSTPEPQVPSPRPALPPVAVVPAPPPAPVTASWEDRPRMAGDWVYRQDERGSVALFGQAGRDADFLVRCDRSKARIFLSRVGSLPEDQAGQMTVRASHGAQSYVVNNTGATPSYLAASLSTVDPILDAMAYSRGKFLVSVKGLADLVIPAWAEVARVIEDCR
jgi:hypothetical protein